jgi:hypothetical protein
LRHAGLGVRDPGRLLARQLDRQGGHDLPDDLVLQREHLAQRSVVSLGPEVMAIQRVDELGVDAHLVAVPPHAALEHVAHPEILGDLLRLRGLALVGPGGVARGDEEAGELGKVGGQVFGDAVGEIPLLGVAA